MRAFGGIAMRIDRNKVINISATVLAGFISVFASFCTALRVNDIDGELSVQMLASSLSMPQSVVANAVSDTDDVQSAVAVTTQPVTTATEKATEKPDEEDEEKLPMMSHNTLVNNTLLLNSNSVHQVKNMTTSL